ncbi:MAG: hypothetical protein WAM61_21450 [Desulfobacterales bacterium]
MVEEDWNDGNGGRWDDGKAKGKEAVRIGGREAAGMAKGLIFLTHHLKAGRRP